MSGEVKVNPTRLTKHADELRNDIASKLEAVRTTLNEATLEGGDFSVTGNFASMAYPGALQFGFEDMETHKKMLEGYATTIEASAKTWRTSEEASTIKLV